MTEEDTQGYGLEPEVEDTVVRERRAAEARVVTADIGAKRTDAVVTDFLGWVAQTRKLHQENHYVPRLRTIFRGESP